MHTETVDSHHQRKYIHPRHDNHKLFATDATAAHKRAELDRIFDGLKFSVEWLTPALAQTWLGTNDSNRSIRKNQIEKISGSIIRDEWMINGETVVFDQSGRMINGQHRCHAVIRTGIAVAVIVCAGVQPAAAMTTDQTSPRSAGDVIGSQNIAFHNTIASALRVVLAADAGSFNAVGCVSNPQISEAMAAHPGLTNWTDLKMPPKFISLSNSAAMAYLFSRKHEPQTVREFFSHVVSGAGLSSGDPPLTLRNRILLDRAHNKLHGTHGKFAQIHLMAMAWRAHVKGVKLFKLILPDELDRFPEIA